jgi:hypothetical protein
MHIRLITGLVCGAALSGAAVAHHSFAMFDMARSITARGVVTDFRWTNPHAWMHVDITDSKGVTANWALEMTSPNTLVGSGWRRSSFKPGDKVTVTYHPLINGKPGGSLVKVVLPNDTVLENK